MKGVSVCFFLDGDGCVGGWVGVEMLGLGDGGYGAGRAGRGKMKTRTFGNEVPFPPNTLRASPGVSPRHFFFLVFFFWLTFWGIFLLPSIQLLAVGGLHGGYMCVCHGSDGVEMSLMRRTFACLPARSLARSSASFPTDLRFLSGARRGLGKLFSWTAAPGMGQGRQGQGQETETEGGERT